MKGNNHGLTDTALAVLKKRYFKPGEDWDGLCHRVAQAIALGNTEDEEKFYDMIYHRRFLPNSPTLMNAGTDLGMLSACFVLPVGDSMPDIFDAVKNAAIVHQGGGGTGFSFSRLRPEGSRVKSTNGVASGPISFMKVFNEATETIKQGGTRRGANMGVLRIDHPNILEFIDCKKEEGAFANFNISVGITDVFMAAIKDGTEYDLINPHDKSVAGRLKAADVFNKIVDNAWLNGEPGLVFLDEINRYNPTPHVGEIEATNPCWSGDTKVWTINGPKTFQELAESGADVPVLSQDSEGNLCFRMMRNPRCTHSNTAALRIHLDNDTYVVCTPNHNLYLKDGNKVQAKDLAPGDRLESVYRYRANGKGYMRLTNGQDQPLEHHVVASWKAGRRPNYPEEHCHHLDGDKQNNLPGNLEIQAAKDHNRTHMLGEDNPMYGVWDERNPLYGKDVSGSNNPRYRQDVADEEIARLRSAGLSYADIAQRVGCGKITVMRRLGYVAPGSREAVANHRVVSIEPLTDTIPVYNGTVDETHRYFVFCGENDAILSANCGEEPLLPYASCNLGSINLAEYYDQSTGGINYYQLGLDVRAATLFLDNVIEANNYPIPQIDEMTKRIRPIGLGIMGMHDLLILLGLGYDTEDGRECAATLMKFIRQESIKFSEHLAEIRGPYPAYNEAQEIAPYRRNSVLTTIAPTGTISMIADCSSGCEPYFAPAMVKHVMDGAELPLVNKHLERIAREEGWYSDELMLEIAKTGTVIGNPRVPGHYQSIFKGAQDISARDHILMQAALQPHVCAAISKTINLPNSATRDDVALGYLLAHELKCKGLTVYRDGSRDTQVLYAGKKESEQPAEDQGESCNRSDFPTDLLFERELLDVEKAERHRVIWKGAKAYMIVSLDDDDQPIEVFIKLPREAGVNGKGYYEASVWQERMSNWDAVCRLVSLLLRVGMPLHRVIQQLEKSSYSMVDAPGTMLRVLSRYLPNTVDEDMEVEEIIEKGLGEVCPDCGEPAYVREGGCKACKLCGYSECK